jgi:N-acylneuraminate cytidylyltransferase
MVALIPARAGSQRVTGKNTKPLGGVPLIAWTIAAAQESGVFDRVCIATDDPAVRALTPWDGRTFFHDRAPVADHQADIDWIREYLSAHPRPYTFAVLRPTSPFRTAATIQRAYKAFTVCDGTHDSLRAVEPAKQHPGKMWEWAGRGYPITPLLRGTRSDGVPWHSCPTQTLPIFYVQNSSLEMAYTANVEAHGTIHGRKVMPFFTEGLEGFAIDYPEDWDRAERLVSSGAVAIPRAFRNLRSLTESA